MEYGRQAPISTAGHSNTAHMGVTPTRRVGGSVVTMGSVHVFCCVPGIHPPDYVLTAHENLGKKTGNVCTGNVRTK